jgi:UDP-N-acetylmuramoylalanine--D-glutamate ligase
MKLKNKKIAVLGSARSGLAAARKAKKHGAKVFISECKEKADLENASQLEKEFSCEFGGHTEEILKNEIIVVSPGVPTTLPVLQKAKQKQLEVMSEIEFAYRLKHKNSKIIAVTGSNGKSTTVSLIAAILENSGYKTILAGNIGNAFSAFPIEEEGIDFIVLELSSFQLELLQKFKADVAAVLNITPDHLNRYENFQDYALTKFNIFKNQDKKYIAVLNFDDHFCRKQADNLKAELKFFSLQKQKDIFFQNNKIYWENTELDISQAKLQGPHNVANIMAAILCTQKFDIKNLEATILNFSPLQHRLEKVAEINGISFINDSKATNTESVKYALQSFQRPIRIIMGGRGKGEDYSVLNKLLKKHVCKAYLIGEEAEQIRKAIAAWVDTTKYDSFSQAIKTAFLESKKGDVVLLSPACTSYDMFQNFEERGQAFKKVVKELEDEQ